MLKYAWSCWTVLNPAAKCKGSGNYLHQSLFVLQVLDRCLDVAAAKSESGKNAKNRAADIKAANQRMQKLGHKVCLFACTLQDIAITVNQSAGLESHGSCLICPRLSMPKSVSLDEENAVYMEDIGYNLNQRTDVIR